MRRWRLGSVAWVLALIVVAGSLPASAGGGGEQKREDRPQRITRIEQEETPSAMAEAVIEGAPYDIAPRRSRLAAQTPEAQSFSIQGFSSLNTTSVNVFPGTVSTTATALSANATHDLVVVDGFAYVATTGAIKKVNLTTGNVTTFAGDPATTNQCTPNANPSLARFQIPRDIDTDGTYLYVADTGCGVWKIALADGATTRLILSPSPFRWDALTYAPDGYLYLVKSNGSLWWIDPALANPTAATVPGLTSEINSITSVTADDQYLWILGIRNSASSNTLLRVTVGDFADAAWYTVPGDNIAAEPIASAGKFIYARWESHQGVVRISKRTGAVGVVAGATTTGDRDGDWTYAQFGTINGVATDGTGILVTDDATDKMRRITFDALRARAIGPGSTAAGSVSAIMTGDPINPATGGFYESFTDLSLPGIGLPFTFTRHYNSMSPGFYASQGRFGDVGWSDTFDVGMEFWSDHVEIHMAEGQVLTFTPGTPGLASYTPEAGVFASLSFVGGGDYELRQPDGMVYRFDGFGRLEQMRDRTGHTITPVWDASIPDSLQLDYVIDSVGRQIDFRYEISGCPTRLSKIVLPDGRYVEYNYNSCKLDRAYELDADGASRRYTKHVWSGPYLNYVNHTGLVDDFVFKNVYDDSGKVSSQQLQPYAQSVISTYEYSVLGTGDTQTLITRNGHVWRHTFSADGVLASILDPAGTSSTHSFDARGMPTAVILPGGQNWTYEYGQNGDLLAPSKVTPPNGNERVLYEYAEPAFPTLPTKMTDGKGNVTRWEYDPATGDLKCQILATTSATSCAAAPQSSKVSYTYDPSTHLVTGMTDPNGATTTYAYFGPGDGVKHGLLKSVTTQMGLKTSYDYNTYAQQVSMVTPQGNAQADPAPYTWTYAYDDAGRIISSRDPFGATHETTYGYDAEGNLTSTVDADGHGGFAAYHPGGILCATSRSASLTCSGNPADSVKYTYDGDGYVASVQHSNVVSDGVSRVTTYTYHPDGALASVTNPVGGWLYSPPSKTPTSTTVVETPPTGDAVTRVSDAMGRPTLVTYAASSKTNIDSSPPVGFVYDDAGNLCNAIKNPTAPTCATAGRVKFTYDPLNRMFPGNGFTYTYDGLNLKSRAYPGGKNIAYAYDADHRLCGINYSLTPPANCSAGTINWDYSAVTAATAKVTKNVPNAQTILTIDKAGRLTKILNNYGASLAKSSSYDLTLSPAGYPVTVAAVNNGLGNNYKTETQGFQFDSLGRLTHVCYDGTTSGDCGTTGTILKGVKYTYDWAGNITRRQTFGSGAGNTYYGYSAADRVCWYGTTSAASTSCTVPSGNTSVLYNTAGDRRSIGTTGQAIRYDQAHRMTSAAVGSTTTTYSYDALGDRATEKVGTQAQTAFTWDPNAAVAQLATTVKGSTTTNYFYSGSLEASQVGTGTRSYYQYDQTGSVSTVISGTSIAGAGSYQPYGLPRQGTPGVFGFQHEYKDSATGFINLRARMYDPATQSFLQEDPVGAFPGYGFAAGNPAMLSDPSGMVSWRDVLDWFNEHLNPAYHYLNNCFGADGSQSLGGWAAGCTFAATGLVATAAAPVLGARTSAGQVADDGISLYRSVSRTELSDIRASGALRPSARGVEGKYFAGSIDDATEWGARLGNEAIIEVSVPRSLAAELTHWAKLDGIGSAWFADASQLARISQHLRWRVIIQ